MVLKPSSVELGGQWPRGSSVKKPQEELRSKVRKQQNQRGNVGKPQESSVSYETKLTGIIICIVQGEDREKKHRE